MLERQDLKKVNDSTLWATVKGMMPRDTLALYVPLSRQLHEIRMVVNDDTMRGFQDFTAHLRVQFISEENPLPNLPPWVSTVNILLPGGKEIPFPDGYTVNLDKIFFTLGGQDQLKGKGNLVGAFRQIADDCVRVIVSPPPDTSLMRHDRLVSTHGHANII